MNSEIYNSDNYNINSGSEYNTLKLKLDKTLKILEAEHLEIQCLWEYTHSLEKMLESERYLNY